jgi:hypothetical protein
LERKKHLLLVLEAIGCKESNIMFGLGNEGIDAEVVTVGFLVRIGGYINIGFVV